MSPLLPISGLLVGFSLGLTGGGGAIFAVPLLVYMLDVPAREAVGVSLITVGTTALVGFVQRARRGQVEFPTGLLFALAGMFGAPIGSWIADRMAESLLLGLFTLLMLAIAVRMWRKANQPKAQLPVLSPAELDENDGPTCRRDPQGKLRITSPCALLLAAIGVSTGVLTGLFGVGGGFIIVPALVMFSGMGMQRAVGTSLLVITFVSISGTASFLLGGRELSPTVVAGFTAGSIVGLFAGTWLSQRLAGPTLQKTFAAAILVVAMYVVGRTVWG
ncbi:MAG: sulfite exporter TauE/SafE family protein [Planctomycetales bacterium]|nr:sulfite exporter TauE/SafE family protein [Planctomycetales bacterium]